MKSEFKKQSVRDIVRERIAAKQEAGRKRMEEAQKIGLKKKK